MSRIPEVTNLQAFVLRVLLDGDAAGRDLRARLEEAGDKKSAPAFYQMMARLEDAGLVEGRYEQAVAGGYTVKERWYHLTAKGEAALADVRSFLEMLTGRPSPGVRPAGA